MNLMGNHNAQQVSLLVCACTREDVILVILGTKLYVQYANEVTVYGTKIAPRLKCFKNASRLNRYNIPTDNAIDFLFSTLHSEMV